MGYQKNPDVSLLGLKHRDFAELKADGNQSHQVLIFHAENMLDVAENTGSEITYGCVRCRSCKECKDAEHIETRNIKEEV